MNLNDWQHFVWIPNDIVIGKVDRLLFRYIHELYHYNQSIDPSRIDEADEKLKFLRKNGYLPTQLAIDTFVKEFDAELGAINTFTELFGNLRMNTYILSESENENLKKKFNRILELKMFLEDNYPLKP